MVTVFGLGAAVSAQSGTMAKDQMDKNATMQKDGQMTVSGCVTAGKDAGQFMLTNAMMMGGGMMNKDSMDKDSMNKDSMKPGMSGDHMMSYELVGGTNLKAHMGHKVEVMGSMSKMDMEHMGKMGKMDKMAQDKAMSDKDMKAMKLNVSSVKMISATCP